MATDPPVGPELQVKSIERVRDLGEVFTPSVTVHEMLDLLPAEMWSAHPSATFLEPACGDGNFIVAILDRKLGQVTASAANGTLPAGTSDHALQFHALEALSSIYAVDFSTDNVIGGTPGHEIGARTRLIDHLTCWYSHVADGMPQEPNPMLAAATWIVERNVQVGNMLPFNADGTASRRDELALVEYRWEPISLSVTLFTTTLGAAAQLAATEIGEELSLFGPPEPTEVWTGTALQIHEAPIEAPVASSTLTRNGKGIR